MSNNLHFLLKLWTLLAIISIITSSDLPLLSRWSLKGKNILVTGGTLGIGKAIVEECAALGAHVFTCARNEKALTECLKEWKEKGYYVEGCVADMGIENDRQTLIENVKKTFSNKLNGVINNVGTNIRKRAIEYSIEEYEHIMNTNLHATYHLTMQLYPLLKGQDSCVVNIGSVAGIL